MWSENLLKTSIIETNRCRKQEYFKAAKCIEQAKNYLK